jgi:hypothetical protein
MTGWLPPVDRIGATFTEAGDPSAARLLIEAARNHPGAIATLLSWWEVQGVPLPAPLAGELDTRRRRMAEYDLVLDRCRSIEPAVVAAKGPTMAALYPRGLVRESGDLDLIFSAPPGLWAVARSLHRQGWDPAVAWAWRLGGTVHFHTALTHPSEEPMLLHRKRVELSTIAYQGDHLRRPPRLRAWSDGDRPSLADCLLWLLEELTERPLRMRDIFDLAVLVHRAQSEAQSVCGFVAEAAAGVDAYGLHAPLRQLQRASRRHHPDGVPLLGMITRGVPGRHGHRRPWLLRRRPLVTTIALAAAISRTGSRPSIRNSADAGSLLLQRRASLPTLFERGVPFYGMPLPGSKPVDRVTLSFERDGMWIDTPVGRFVATLGSAVRQEWVDRAGNGCNPSQRMVLL